jgi:hypothetical protein
VAACERSIRCTAERASRGASAPPVLSARSGSTAGLAAGEKLRAGVQTQCLERRLLRDGRADDGLQPTLPHPLRRPRSYYGTAGSSRAFRQELPSHDGRDHDGARSSPWH